MAGKAENRSFKKLLFFFIKVVLAAAIITFLIYKNYDSFVKHLSNFRLLWLIPAGICYFIHLLVGAWRWQMLTKVMKITMSFRDAFFLTMKAYFFSLVIPGGAIGGDIAKIGFLSARTPKGRKLDGALTILMDRICGMMALFSTTIVVAFFARGLINNFQHNAIRVAVWALVAVSFAGLAASFVLFMHRYLEKIPLVSRLIALADRYSGNAFTRATAAIDAYNHNWRTVLFATLISVVFIHLNMVAVVYCVACGLGVKIPALTLIATVIMGNIAGLIPVTVSGIGIRDGIIEEMFSGAGISAGIATAIPIIYTAIIIAFNMTGSIFFILDKNIKLPENEPVEQ